MALSLKPSTNGARQSTAQDPQQRLKTEPERSFLYLWRLPSFVIIRDHGYKALFTFTERTFGHWISGLGTLT